MGKNISILIGIIIFVLLYFLGFNPHENYKHVIKKTNDNISLMDKRYPSQNNEFEIECPEELNKEDLISLCNHNVFVEQKIRNGKKTFYCDFVVLNGR